MLLAVVVGANLELVALLSPEVEQEIDVGLVYLSDKIEFGFALFGVLVGIDFDRKAWLPLVVA